MIIKLDKERNFNFDLAAIEKFEEATGKNFFTGNIFENITAADWVIIAWVGLLYDDPTLTQEQVSHLVDLPALHLIMKAINPSGGKEDKSPL